MQTTPAPHITVIPLYPGVVCVCVCVKIHYSLRVDDACSVVGSLHKNVRGILSEPDTHARKVGVRC